MTSLPGGCLDDDVLHWLDFLHESGISVWQVLPLVVPDRAGSPYQSRSAFATNPALLPPGAPRPADDVVDAFRARHAGWVETFSLFCALAAREGHRAWWRWPEPLARRDPDALEAFAARSQTAIRDVVTTQCAVEEAWQAVRREAAQRGIAVFGDMPIFIDHESADVWENPSNFLLDENFQPRYVTGVPPDYFSDTGQRWGNPHYDWAVMATRGFDWWLARVARQLEWFDLVRLDHFRALSAVWMIDARSDSATEGFWAETPGRSLLERIRERHAGLPIVAEDLGFITDDVHALRRSFDLPGMAVLQFAFDGSPENPHRPENIGRDRVAYTGTHDNDTCVGWYDALDPGTRRFVRDVLGRGDDADIAGIMIDAALESAACLAVVPLQDVLGLGTRARMNTPGRSNGNWQWRFDWSQIGDALASSIRSRVDRSGRVFRAR